MKMIKAPVEFRSASRNLAGMSFEAAISAEDSGMIGYFAYYFLMGSTSRERDVMRQFLDRTLAAGVDDAALAEFWRTLPSAIHVPEGRGVRTLLTAIRAQLDHRPAPAYRPRPDRAPWRGVREAAMA